jgi:hypothetical protein
MSTSHARNARSLLQDNINGVNGTELIQSGKGFEMYHLRIKSGFSRGLGTEAITHLTEYVTAVQQSQESIRAYFDRMCQLYEQVQLTKGCNIGETAQKSFTLEGLRRGAYHKVLGPWVKKTLIGQGRLKLDTATMSSLQHGATDLLATSHFFKGNVLLAGKLPHPVAAAARAATDGTDAAPPNDSSDCPGADPAIEGIVRQLRGGFSLSHSQTAWIRKKYRCIHCLSNSHSLEECRAIIAKWNVTAAPPSTTPAPGGRLQNGRIAGSRRDQRDRHNTTQEQATTTPRPAKPTPPSQVATPNPKAQVATIGATQGEETDSDPDESDDAFTHLGYESDPDLLSAITHYNFVGRKYNPWY